MFENIGGKIKKVAEIVAWTGIICSIIIGIKIIGDAVGSLKWGVIKGVFYAGIGALSSWIGSFVLYGFGTLIENSDKAVSLLEKQEDCANVILESYKSETVKRATENADDHSDGETKRAFFERKNPDIRVLCPHCKTMQKGDNDYCEYCGATFIYRKMS